LSKPLITAGRSFSGDFKRTFTASATPPVTAKFLPEEVGFAHPSH